MPEMMAKMSALDMSRPDAASVYTPPPVPDGNRDLDELLCCDDAWAMSRYHQLIRLLLTD